MLTVMSDDQIAVFGLPVVIIAWERGPGGGGNTQREGTRDLPEVPQLGERAGRRREHSEGRDPRPTRGHAAGREGRAEEGTLRGKGPATYQRSRSWERGPGGGGNTQREGTRDLPEVPQLGERAGGGEPQREGTRDYQRSRSWRGRARREHSEGRARDYQRSRSWERGPGGGGNTQREGTRDLPEVEPMLPHWDPTGTPLGRSASAASTRPAAAQSTFGLGDRPVPNVQRQAVAQGVGHTSTWQQKMKVDGVMWEELTTCPVVTVE
ncbi:unnamed protein product [Gadus morhua 'NCC']